VRPEINRRVLPKAGRNSGFGLRSSPRQSEHAGCSTRPLPPELEQKPNQSLRDETASEFRRTLTTNKNNNNLILNLCQSPKTQLARGANYPHVIKAQEGPKRHRSKLINWFRKNGREAAVSCNRDATGSFCES
jgi:hypothetical protein